MTRPAGALCAGLLVAVLLVFAAPPAHADSLRISVFGDSVLLGAADEITAALAGNDVSVDAHEDLSLLGALRTLEAARPAIGDVVVLDFGYNDGPDPAAWRDRVDRAMAILDGVPKVIWLSQSEFANGRAEMNAELRAATARYRNLEVVDWNAVVAAHPDFVYGDVVHLTPAGRTAMADAVHQRVESFVAARTAATSTTAAATPSTSLAATVARGGGRGATRRVQPRGIGPSGSDEPWIGVAIAGGLVALVAVAAALRLRARLRPS